MNGHVLRLAAIVGAVWLFNPGPALSGEVTIASPIETMDAMVPQFGEHLGVFAKRNIQLKYVKALGPAMIAAVEGGSADILHAGVSNIFPSIKRGANVRVLSGNYDIDYSFIVQRSLGLDLKKPLIENLRLLSGKRIGVAGRGGATELLATQIFAKAGMESGRDFAIIGVGVGFAAAGAFNNDQIDAFISLPPVDVLIPKEKYDVLVDLSTVRQTIYNPDYVFTVFAASESFVSKRADEAKQFCEAVKETMELIKGSKKDDFKSFLASKLKLTADGASEIVNVYSGNYRYPLSKERWDAMSKYMEVPSFEQYTFKPCIEL